MRHMVKRMHACIQLKGKNVENKKVRQTALAAFEKDAEENLEALDEDFDASELPRSDFGGLQIVPSCRFRQQQIE